MNSNVDERNDQVAQESHELTRSGQLSFGDRCIESCKKLLTQMENVKAAVVSDFRDRLEEHHRILELALNEAEALAWESGFPQLLFPDLALEKAFAVAGWHQRQQAVLRRASPRLLAA